MNIMGPILVSIIMWKLPSEIRLVISRSMATLTASTANDEWKIDQLLEYVKAELESRELCNFVANPNEEPRSRRGLQNGDYSTSFLLTDASNKFNLVCTYCGKYHATSKCDIVTEISARKSLL